MISFQVVEKLKSKSFHKKEVWINEAEFGFLHLEDYLSKLPQEAQILEVGCGSGILLSMIAEVYPKLNCEGIEPFGDGFGSFKDLNTFVKSQGVNILNLPYQKLKPSKKYDLIYLVNVFEHLESWKDFLKKIDGWLNEGGKCVILCPNYGFPYESHFRIPIIINKVITYRIFKKYIHKFEKEDNSDGLWDSLNFVSKNKVFSYLKQINSLNAIDRREILEQMVLRLNTDVEFKKRQSFVGLIALTLLRLNLLKIFNLLPNLSPYMKLELIKVK
tara:strand:- start:3676 stop:4494 length:819 start_codon:yes stop_codon:yes gene_type:complete